jgi:recombination protein RecT
MTAPNQTGIIQKTAAKAPAKQGQPTTIKGWLKAYEGEIARALPEQIGKERFNRICMTAVTSNPTLSSCTVESFIGAVLNSAQLGLEPNTPLGQAFLIPYKNNKTDKMEVQFQIGYKGLIKLARNSGQIAMIKAYTVYQNDDFSYELGLNPTIHHVPFDGDRGPATAYYAFYKTKDGDFDFEVMTRKEAEAHRNKYSKSKNGPWSDNFDEMAKKTVLKKVLKYAPLETEIQRTVSQDNSIKYFDTQDVDAMKEMQLVPAEEVEYIEVEAEETPNGNPGD